MEIPRLPGAEFAVLIGERTSLGETAANRLKSPSGAQLKYVPLRGGGPAMNDLVAGHVPSPIASAPSSPRGTISRSHWCSPTRRPGGCPSPCWAISAVTRSSGALALIAVARSDAFVAVFDAKYHDDFWRPITAIRNGDLDDHPGTERDATWQPLEATPMHPEYPCAHCIQSGSVASVVKAVLSTVDIPEVAMTSPTASGVTHPLDQPGRLYR